ncbi:MAG: hypothetical protein RLZZ458_936 [Planctomycetota bacterium]
MVVLEWGLVDGGLWFGFDPVGFRVEALVKGIDEVGVKFDEVELVVRLEELDDAVGNGSGAGSNFEYASGL